MFQFKIKEKNLKQLAEPQHDKKNKNTNLTKYTINHCTLVSICFSGDLYSTLRSPGLLLGVSSIFFFFLNTWSDLVLMQSYEVDHQILQLMSHVRLTNLFQYFNISVKYFPFKGFLGNRLKNGLRTFLELGCNCTFSIKESSKCRLFSGSNTFTCQHETSVLLYVLFKSY